jgi:hypothetical protein
MKGVIMPLPKLVSPTYELKLPSTDQVIKFRPFLVKEEKILLIAMESEDEKQITTAIKTILKNCVLSKIKIDDLALFDIEYLFLNVRGKSVGEEISLRLLCPDDQESYADVSINIEDIKIQKSEEHDRNIKLNDSIGMVMKYPNLDMFVKNNFGTGSQVDDVFEIASTCIEQIFEGEEVFEVKNFSKKEVMDFLDSLNTEQFLMIQKFFETMPKLKHTVQVTNPNTGVISDVEIEGLANFFA